MLVGPPDMTMLLILKQIRTCIRPEDHGVLPSVSLCKFLFQKQLLTRCSWLFRVTDTDGECTEEIISVHGMV